MGKAIFDAAAAARQVFEQADGVLGMELSKLCFEGPEEELKLTFNTQPAILTTSIALLRAFEERGARADFVAGHSLGEYSALVAAGCLRFEDAVGAVRRRGLFMQDAVPEGVGAMAALIGCELETVRAICDQASSVGVCAPANINSPTQTVIAGHKAAIELAVKLAEERGAQRAMMLAVSAPFHCELMKPAARRLAPVLDAIEFNDLSVPVVTNVDARPIRSGAEAKDALLRQVEAPVRWSESIKLLMDEGVTLFIEVGPGKVLSGLVKRISRELKALSVSDVESLDAAAQALERLKDD